MVFEPWPRVCRWQRKSLGQGRPLHARWGENWRWNVEVYGVLQARNESAIVSVEGCCNYEHRCSYLSRFLLGVWQCATAVNATTDPENPEMQWRLAALGRAFTFDLHRLFRFPYEPRFTVGRASRCHEKETAFCEQVSQWNWWTGSKIGTGKSAWVSYRTVREWSTFYDWASIRNQALYRTVAGIWKGSQQWKGRRTAAVRGVPEPPILGQAEGSETTPFRSLKCFISAKFSKF